MSFHSSTQQNIRLNKLSKRSLLTEKTINEYSKQLLLNILTAKLLENTAHIAVYIPISNEIDTQPLIEYCWRQGIKTYLPICHRHKLHFALYNRLSTLQKNKFNILEPIDSTIIPINEIDIVFTPLVAFDKHGNRIGMGKGYYDKTFSTIKPKKLIGLAYSFQEVDSIQPNDNDIPLDQVFTEVIS